MVLRGLSMYRKGRPKKIKEILQKQTRRKR